MKRCRLSSLFLAGLLLAASLAAQSQSQGGEFQVNTTTAYDQQYPAVSADAAGNFVVVWRSWGQDGSGTSIHAQRFAADGTALDGEFRANSFTMWDQFVPAVGVAPNGDFVIVWGSQGEQDGSEYSVHGQRYAANGAPLGGEFQINTYTPGRQSYPDIALDADGDFVVVWHSDDQDGEGDSVQGQRFGADGTPEGNEFQVNTATALDQRTPAVAMRASGQFAVVWKADAAGGNGNNVHGQRYAADGTPLGGEFQVSNHTFFGEYAPDVAFDGDGNFTVVWDGEQDGDPVGVQGRLYDPDGTPRSDEFQINTYTTGHQDHPRLVAATDGTLAVVWDDSNQEGSGSGIFGQMLTADGDPIGGEFHVNTHTADWQDRPAIAAAPIQDFVVVWQSRDQDGSGHSVQGQRFSGLIGPDIFADGFESGDTSAWSATVP